MMIGHYALGTLHLQAGLAAMLPWGRESERAVMTAVVPEHVAMAAMQKESQEAVPIGKNL